MDLKKLKTEKRNRASSELDRMGALEIARLMNREDARVARAVKRVLPQVAKAIDIIARRLERGGQLIYVGTGTSGRIGALDAVEVPPTFGVAVKKVQFVIAGGEEALARAVEASEDDAAQGRLDLAARKPGQLDVVVGIAASGRTPYTIGALKHAGRKGAATIAVVCNRGSELAHVAQLAIEVDVGPEVLTGSTRLKAGTAQKMICNMLTTGAMARMGLVYGNLMVNTRPRNSKLFERAISMLQHIAGVDHDAAVEALQASGLSIPHALIMLKAGVSKREAERRLREQQGVVRQALSQPTRSKKR
jgi:N-acetylmuramic acid 6-phosphate etherase